jgi:1-acyl-sn-glycerol-3-phosphate acyltransferase
MFLSSSYRPDPFRFRPPQEKYWLYWFFHLLNRFLLRFQFNIREFHLLKSQEKILRQMTTSCPTLIMPNHSNFIDPHIVLELTMRARVKALWIAGIEPFDTANGLFGWFIQSSGTYSIDRGVLDRFSIEKTQAILKQGRDPLVIFPEGEADYTNTQVDFFYPGVSQFALYALKHHPKIAILPMTIRYELHHTTPKALYGWVESLYLRLGGLKSEATHLEGLATQLIQQALFYMKRHQDPAIQLDPARSLAQQLDDYATTLLTALSEEHLSGEFKAPVTLQGWMDAKNRLRSIIARKRYAPPLSELSVALDWAQTFSTFEAAPSAQQWRFLSQHEKKWLGQAYPEEIDFCKRGKRLYKHLKSQLSYAQLETIPELLARWEEQLNTTRRIKLLKLLERDCLIGFTTLERIEEILSKVSIMALSEFPYQAQKKATLCLAEPIILSAESAPEISELTQQLHQALISGVQGNTSTA